MSRTRFLAPLAVSVLLVTLALGTASAEAAPANRGVQLHSLWGATSDAEMERELDLSRDAGSTTVRVDVGWSSLETAGKGEYSEWYVNKLDRFVSGASARGMKVIATVWSTPCWASTAPESKKQGCAGAWWDREVTMYPPKDNSDFADISRWITARYGTKLAALEVWNEPNLPEDRFWIAPDEAGAYANLVKATYPAVKAANPDVKVLAGSLAAADRPFLEALYAKGMKGSYDAISIHPYNEDRAPSDRWKDQYKKYTFLPGIEWIHEAQQAAGDDTPLWLTEFGWTSCSGQGWCVSERQQADYIRQAFDILQTKDYVKGAIVYNLRSKGSNSDSFEDNFGLVRENFSPKPVYAALRDGLTGSGSAVEAPPVAVPPIGAPPETADSAEVPPRPDVDAPPEEAVTGSDGRPVGSGGSSGRAGQRPPPRQPQLTLRVNRRGTTAYAAGRGPRRRQLTVRVSSCASRRTVTVRTDSLGRFNRQLGSVRRLRGCRVTASLGGSRAPAVRISVI